MTKYKLFVVLFVCSGIAWAQHDIESAGIQAPGLVIQEMDCGHLVVPPYTRECGELFVYFPGHAQEIGLKGSVPKNKRKAWLNQLLDSSSYQLRSSIENTGCPVLVLGDSQSTVSAAELESLMKRLSLGSLQLLSHSGGNVGMSASIASWPAAIHQKVSAVKLLDNFYSAHLARTLENAFGSPKLEQMCTGFVTAHNFGRFENLYRRLCPRVSRSTESGAHKAWVRRFFSK